MLPPDRITSPEQPITLEPFFTRALTPMTFLFVIISFSTNVFVIKFILGLLSMGFKKASAALNLLPFLMLT